MGKYILAIILGIISFNTKAQQNQYIGKVGINTTTPQQTLDVNGTVRIADLPLGDSNDYLVVVDNTGKLKKIPVSLLQQVNNSCPYLVKSSSDGYYLVFTASTALIANPNDPITVQGKNFNSAGTWISNNTHFYTYTNTTGQPIDLNIQFNITFGTFTCTY